MTTTSFPESAEVLSFSYTKAEEKIPNESIFIFCGHDFDRNSAVVCTEIVCRPIQPITVSDIITFPVYLPPKRIISRNVFSFEERGWMFFAKC